MNQCWYEYQSLASIEYMECLHPAYILHAGKSYGTAKTFLHKIKHKRGDLWQDYCYKDVKIKSSESRYPPKITIRQGPICFEKLVLTSIYR